MYEETETDGDTAKVSQSSTLARAGIRPQESRIKCYPTSSAIDVMQCATRKGGADGTTQNLDLSATP